MYTSFVIAEAKVTRRIWIYLPKDYPVSGKSYPVLYMQDGQNLFDVKSSFSGEWEIDEYMDSIQEPCIVVGIDNGGETRINEYNPNDTESHGAGMGKEYLQRLVDILKPYVDQNFRTKPEPAFTAIAGSSLGGLITFYAALYHPEVFGHAGIFSPSFWIVPDIGSQVMEKAKGRHRAQRFYFYGGGKEGAEMEANINLVSGLVRKNLDAEVTVVIAEKGTHSESSWRKMFPDFYVWLAAGFYETPPVSSKKSVRASGGRKRRR
ncbi:MAG: alpha/beta hydrolase [Chitinophagales bacterium]|nr:alpha/beta hydrolase [Chitinophagales bacterium]